MEEMINLIVSNGMAIVIIAYMLFKDFRFNETITKTLGSINETLAQLNLWHNKDGDNNETHR